MTINCCVAPGARLAVSGDRAIEVRVTGFAAAVITVELAVDVVNPEAVSLALIVVVCPAVAPIATVTTPVVSTVATAVFDEVKLSPAAASVAVELSL